MYTILLSITLFGLLVFFPLHVRASATVGTIDSTDFYAWASNAGWVNFLPTGGNVTVTDTQLSGIIWSENYGWIDLQPSLGGVTNDGAGNLGGYAWGAHIGWLDFNGVTIDSTGYFHGYASSSIIGQVNFNCANTNTCASSNFKVRTDWRPASARSTPTPAPSPAPSSGGGGGGGGVPFFSAATSSPVAPLVVAVASSAPAAVPEAKLVVRSATCPVFVKSLKKGVRDPEVVKIQTFLQHYGFLSPNIRTTTYFGTSTLEAVKRFQLAYRTQIMDPWGADEPSGWWYITTRRQANLLVDCKPSGVLVVKKTPAGMLNIRSAPSFDAPFVGKVKTGEKLVFSDRHDMWANVELPGGGTGWVHTNYTLMLKK